jgi:hypothetical protein
MEVYTPIKAAILCCLKTSSAILIGLSTVPVRNPLLV